MNCEKCGSTMNKAHGYKHNIYICPECKYEVRQSVGKKKFFGIRLYEYQKQIADKRGGVQMVVDAAIDEAGDEKNG